MPAGVWTKRRSIISVSPRGLRFASIDEHFARVDAPSSPVTSGGQPALANAAAGDWMEGISFALFSESEASASWPES
jgi:hypothetical protein